jgi:competence protein ComEA
VKYLVPVLAALGLGAFVWFRPGPQVGVAAQPAFGWQSAAPSPHSGTRRTVPATTSVVYVAGEVRKPGLYPLRAGARVGDAVAAAGGARPGADPVAVNLAAHVADGDEIVVPKLGAAAAAPPHPRRSAAGPRRRAGKGRPHRSATAPASIVDLNSADAETLASLPGIGPGLAERIVAFREANGPFASPDELLDVAGFTDRRLDAVLPYVVAR